MNFSDYYRNYRWHINIRDHY